MSSFNAEQIASPPSNDQPGQQLPECTDFPNMQPHAEDEDELLQARLQASPCLQVKISDTNSDGCESCESSSPSLPGMSIPGACAQDQHRGAGQRGSDWSEHDHQRFDQGHGWCGSDQRCSEPGWYDGQWGDEKPSGSAGPELSWWNHNQGYDQPGRGFHNQQQNSQLSQRDEQYGSDQWQGGRCGNGQWKNDTWSGLHRWERSPWTQDSWKEQDWRRGSSTGAYGTASEVAEPQLIEGQHEGEVSGPTVTCGGSSVGRDEAAAVLDAVTAESHPINGVRLNPNVHTQPILAAGKQCEGTVAVAAVAVTTVDPTMEQDDLPRNSSRQSFAELVEILATAKTLGDKNLISSVEGQLRDAMMARTSALATTIEASARRSLYEQASLSPAMQILQTCRNVLQKAKKELNPKFSLTSLERFHATAITVVELNSLKSWITSQLALTKLVPAEVQTHLIALTDGLQQSVQNNTNFVYDKGKGTVYRITYMLKKHQGEVGVVLVVFGACFEVDFEMPASISLNALDGALVSEDGQPFSVPSSTSGTPAMSGEEIKEFMDYLEGFAAQEIWDQASPAQKKSVGGMLEMPPPVQEVAILGATDGNGSAGPALLVGSELQQEGKAPSLLVEAKADALNVKKQLECLAAAQQEIVSIVQGLGVTEVFIRLKRLHKRKQGVARGSHYAECGANCDGYTPIQESTLTDHTNLPPLCQACFV